MSIYIGRNAERPRIKTMNEWINQCLEKGRKFLPGNDLTLKLGLVTLLTGRHALVEDVPGMGKTTLVHFLSKIFALEFHRIQFTSDLLPSDLIGLTFYRKEKEDFVFRPGPLFGELILADELNRGGPKTQSALLQAMEEKTVTVDNKSHELSDLFCVIATQNPRHQIGTFPLPESQLDRFLFKFSMGKMSHEEEVFLLQTGARMDQFKEMKPLFNKEALRTHRTHIKQIKVATPVIEYVTHLLQNSRGKHEMSGLSPRCGLDLIEAAKAWAYIHQRDYVLPDDIMELFPYVAGHRLFYHQQQTTETEHLKALEYLKTVHFNS